MEWLPILIIGLVVLACPLAMRFGMRGMHGAQRSGSGQAGRPDAGVPNAAGRLRELEKEVAELKQQMLVPGRNEEQSITKNGGSHKA